MKKSMLSMSLLVLTANTLAAHYHHEHVNVVVETRRPEYIAVAPVAPVVVMTPPPAPIVEAAIPCPGENYAYIPGYWGWNGQWVWQSQAWVVKPHASAAWEPAHYRWSHHHQNYVWAAGHWR